MIPVLSWLGFSCTRALLPCLRWALNQVAVVAAKAFELNENPNFTATSPETRFDWATSCPSTDGTQTKAGTALLVPRGARHWTQENIAPPSYQVSCRLPPLRTAPPTTFQEYVHVFFFSNRIAANTVKSATCRPSKFEFEWLSFSPDALDMSNPTTLPLAGVVDV